ncbi:unnamed protein product [Linum trigynum]|uniref:Uncharacterized protein n=1 Tax=Linum trigynum TaxID=586398 RepID=A0AAV2GMW4_9ROSI
MWRFKLPSSDELEGMICEHVPSYQANLAPPREYPLATPLENPTLTNNSRLSPGLKEQTRNPAASEGSDSGTIYRYLDQEKNPGRREQVRWRSNDRRDLSRWRRNVFELLEIRTPNWAGGSLPVGFAGATIYQILFLKNEYFESFGWGWRYESEAPLSSSSKP